MAEQRQIPPIEEAATTVPAQPVSPMPVNKAKGLIIGIGAVILVVGIANIGNITTGHAKNAPPNSQLVSRPQAPDANQVNSFSVNQSQQAQHDQEDLARQQQLKAQMDQLQREQSSLPGPEAANAPPMTQAQRDAMYGKDNPSAPKKTSGVSEAQAQAKQRALEREKQHHDAIDSSTVAIDFAHGSSTAPVTAEGEAPGTQETSAGEQAEAPDAMEKPVARPVSTPVPASRGRNAMETYDFDGYVGKLYRVFEGTVFEGVVTNHIDGAFAGPMLVMLTTDYYSHDHQQLLLPQGTRLIGNVQSVGGSGQRKLMVTFNRAICPDGFSLDLNRFTGLDPLGTTGLATNVNNHYFSSFAAAAAVGGLGGLAQIGNSGSILDTGSQLRNGITAQTSQESEQILNKFLNRLPVITVKEGSRARVYINHDILIPSYADHRVDPEL